MTEDDKRKRRDRIKEVNESKTHKPTKETVRELEYWLTRDSDTNGKLSNWIRVWLVRPTLKRVGNGVQWDGPEGTIDSTSGPVRVRYAQWSEEECTRTCRVYPATDRECIKVG